MADLTQVKITVTVPNFIGCLLFSRTQAHIFHWQTTSFARHKALDDYYSGIVDLVDSLVEAYQGTNPIIKGFINNERISNNEEGVIPYFEKLLLYVQEYRQVIGSDSDLQNIIDEIVNLIKSTLYKLKNLK